MKRIKRLTTTQAQKLAAKKEAKQRKEQRSVKTLSVPIKRVINY